MGECANAGRQHPHELREAAMKYLALKIAPSKVLSCMRIGKFNFTGPQPKLRWVQHMRSELLCSLDLYISRPQRGNISCIRRNIQLTKQQVPDARCLSTGHAHAAVAATAWVIGKENIGS